MCRIQITMTITLLLACSEGAGPIANVEPPAPSDRPIAVAEHGYVTSDRCQACHPGQFESWRSSYHRTMTQVVGPETVAADFSPTSLRADDGRIYHLRRRGGEFWVEIESPGAAVNGEPARTAHRLVMSTGSHHFQAFWYSAKRSRILNLVPFFYGFEAKRWMPLDSAFLYAPEVEQPTHGGRWNQGCVWCHSTRPRPGIVSEEVMNTRVAEFGIACEACHGPGEEHVVANRDPVRRYSLHLKDDADPTIVNPAKLDPWRASEVCGQCHAVGETSQDRLVKLRGRSYQPGDPLEKSRPTVREGAGWFWDDGMIRVSGREYNGLLTSPCYTHGDESRGVLGCFSCHRMHQGDDDPRPARSWAHDQVAPGMDGNRACTQCHAGFEEPEPLAAHTRHAPGSTGSSCYNCHMPYTSWGLLGAVRSHEVSSPSVEATLRTGRPNACNLCHLDRTLDWTAAELEAGYGLPRPELDADEREIAASILFALSGDAGQRALVAWSMGWKPALEASGAGWMAPYLAQLLDDPYDAVRYRSHRSLSEAHGFQELEYDFVGPEYQRSTALWRVVDAWQRDGARERQERAALLIDESGGIDRATFDRLLAERDDRPISLFE